MDISNPIWKRLVLLLAALLSMGAIAGCVEEPQEAEPGADDDVGVDGPDDDLPADDGLGDDVGDEGANVENRVLISGAVYECDTFLEVDNAVEGACDEYQLDAEADAADFPDAIEATVVDQERVTINNTTYVCDDDGLEDLWDDDEADEGEVAEDELTAETCEEYVIEGSAE